MGEHNVTQICSLCSVQANQSVLKRVEKNSANERLCICGSLCVRAAVPDSSPRRDSCGTDVDLPASGKHVSAISVPTPFTGCQQAASG